MTATDLPLPESQDPKLNRLAPGLNKPSRPPEVLERDSERDKWGQH